MSSESTKKCPNCSSSQLIKLRSLNEKRCAECGFVIVWNLDDGQKPELAGHRDKR